MYLLGLFLIVGFIAFALSGFAGGMDNDIIYATLIGLAVPTVVGLIVILRKLDLITSELKELKSKNQDENEDDEDEEASDT